MQANLDGKAAFDLMRRTRYAARRAAGLCPNCGRGPGWDAPGYGAPRLLCRPCLAVVQRYRSHARGPGVGKRIDHLHG